MNWYINHRNIWRQRTGYGDEDEPSAYIWISKDGVPTENLGCSGMSEEGFSTRREAIKYIFKHPFRFLFGLTVNEIYYYGGCGCCGLTYIDKLDNKEYCVTWQHAFSHKSEEELLNDKAENIYYHITHPDKESTHESLVEYIKEVMKIKYEK